MRIEHARLQQCWKSCANGSNTLLRYASVITEQKKCWELLAEKFDRFQTLRNNMQQGVQTDATCNISNVKSCWPTMLRPFARGLTVLYIGSGYYRARASHGKPGKSWNLIVGPRLESQGKLNFRLVTADLKTWTK